MKSINPIKMGAQSTIACFGYGGVNSQTSKAREFYTTFIKEKVHSAESLSVQVLYDFLRVCAFLTCSFIYRFIPFPWTKNSDTHGGCGSLYSQRQCIWIGKRLGWTVELQNPVERNILGKIMNT